MAAAAGPSAAGRSDAAQPVSAQPSSAQPVVTEQLHAACAEAESVGVVSAGPGSEESAAAEPLEVTQPRSGVFRVSDERPPDAHAFGERVRNLLDVPFVAVALNPPEAERNIRARAFVVDGSPRARRSDALVSWLLTLQAARSVPVPDEHRAAFAAGQALVVPMRTPVWQVGALAVPASEAASLQLAMLEALAAEFALQMEGADRRGQLAFLRIYAAAAGASGR